MTPELDQLVRDVTDLTGAEPPSWLDDGAPVLSDGATEPAQADGFYLIGLIGGKDVGKSALVNALVGHAITAQTSHGPGTETVIAYAHQSQATALKTLLEAEVPGRYTIITHQLAELRRQVLLDLPDIDSHYMDHVDVTRRMLRHMLFPIWVQSVEKYADRQPQQMLLKVAAGNSPANFVFCLNKVDQVNGSTDTALSPAVRELQDDFAARLARTLQLPAAPRVWAISAIRPERFELPAVRDLLTQQKSTDEVRASKEKAARRQRTSVLDWLDQRDLPGKSARIARLYDEARECISQRLGGPLVDEVIPGLMDDPAYRQAIIDDCMQQRVGRWPVVNVLHVLFGALGTLFRRNTEAKLRPLGARAAELLVDEHLAGVSHGHTTAIAADTPAAESLSTVIQSTFAALQQAHPTMVPLYQHRKLWETVPPTQAAGTLRQTLITTVERQRAFAAGNAAGRDGPFSALLRGIFTIGAVIWFTVGQPIARTFLQDIHTPGATAPTHDMGVMLVDLLSVDNLLRTLTLLILYFTGIWLFIQWDTQRRVNRQFAKWKRMDPLDPTLSLTRAAMDWVSDLLEPIAISQRKFESIAARVEAMGKEESV